MKGKQQKISLDNYQHTTRTESEREVGVQTFIGITENDLTNIDLVKSDLLSQILSPSNLNTAYKQVVRNKGVGGIDKMETGELREYLIQHQDSLIDLLKSGKYSPKPVRRVLIPKEPGKVRKLGVPTVVDRLIQQAIQQILSPIYELQFLPVSYGFRPNRGAQQALSKAQVYISEGYDYGLKLDLENFFDRVNHQKLIEVLSRTISDGRVISLIHKYLNSGVRIGHKFESTISGVPQGSPLSPLLSNIMLHELDKELESRGHRFVRYADDLVIFTRSSRSAMRVLKSIKAYIEDKLYLKVNLTKSQISYYTAIEFLGHSFYRRKGQGRLRVSKESIVKLKKRIKVLTSRSNGWGNERRKRELNNYIIGWVNYFKHSDMKTILSVIDQWYRRRLRMLIWKQWKQFRTRVKNLMKLGIEKPLAIGYARTRKSYWRVSNSSILGSSITNSRLRRAGYLFLLDYYQKVKVNKEPPYTRSVRTVV